MTARRGPLSGRRLLAVFAHPDDECLASGGTLAWCADQGARVMLLCATRGEAGLRTRGSRNDDTALGLVRRGELQQAAHQLGIAEVIFLDHPDGSLTGVDAALFRHEIILTLRHLAPEVVVTFGPDGLYWHPDHIVVHERVTEAVDTLGPAGPALYYVSVPPGLMRVVLETAAANPTAPHDLSLWGIDPEAFGACAPEPTLTLDATAFATRKVEALKCHLTQVGDESPFTWLTADQAQALLGHEYFVRAAAGSDAPSFLDHLRPLAAPI